MRCPFCDENNDRVVDSRESGNSHTIRRRRECLDCGRRYTSYERIEEIPFMVVKRDSSRTEFDRKKLLVGLYKACEKRPVSLAEIAILVDHVEQRLASSGRREVPSETIGHYVLDELKEVDEVAYVRFASVYRLFQSVDEFFVLLKDLQGQKDETS